jgi:hypothetical protein
VMPGRSFPDTTTMRRFWFLAMSFLAPVSL